MVVVSPPSTQSLPSSPNPTPFPIPQKERERSVKTYYLQLEGPSQPSNSLLQPQLPLLAAGATVDYGYLR